MYDWANSAYATVIAGAVLPAYFVSTVVPGDTYRFLGREWAADGLWGLVAGSGPLVMFLLIPVLGAVADFSAQKKRFLTFFALLGSAFTILLFFAAPGRVGATIGIFLLAQMGSWPPTSLRRVPADLHRRHHRPRGVPYALGYIGGGLYLLIGVVIFLSRSAPS